MEVSNVKWKTSSTHTNINCLVKLHFLRFILHSNNNKTCCTVVFRVSSHLAEVLGLCTALWFKFSHRDSVVLPPLPLQQPPLLSVLFACPWVSLCNVICAPDWVWNLLESVKLSDEEQQSTVGLSSDIWSRDHLVKYIYSNTALRLRTVMHFPWPHVFKVLSYLAPVSN